MSASQTSSFVKAASTAADAAVSATTSAASSGIQSNSKLKVVGIILAISSGVLIGSSFVFKKKGLLRSQSAAGEGVAYLKSPLWWTGMIMMILGEICNFGAYAFVEAIVVTPLGALSVVISAVLSSLFLNEKLSFFGWLGCGLCITGSTIIALNGPQEASVGHITEFQSLFLAPGFIVWGSVLIIASLAIVFFFSPKYGKQSMLWYIGVCSMIGGISVSVTTGLGAAIVTTAQGDNQFKHWFIYFLMIFVIATLVTEVYYLNVALALFNTAMVTPTYYVIFTFFSITTTVILFQGLKAPPSQIITLIMGFIVICFGITILQMSKVDPTELGKLDRKSTLLLQAARRNTGYVDEKNLSAFEDPGMDTLRGSFGAIGSIIRARSARRMSMSRDGARASGSGGREMSMGTTTYTDIHGLPPQSGPLDGDPFSSARRYQLYDAPMPRTGSPDRPMTAGTNASGNAAPGTPKKPTAIKFGEEEVVHSYPAPGVGGEGRLAVHESRLRRSDYPPSVFSDRAEDGGSRGSGFSLGTGTGTEAGSGSGSGSGSGTVKAIGAEAESAPRFLGSAFRERGSSESRGSGSSARSIKAEARSSPGGGTSTPQRSPRKYPKGVRDDDDEESIRLWSRASEEFVAEPEPEPELETEEGGEGGIRLVGAPRRA